MALDEFALPPAWLTAVYTASATVLPLCAGHAASPSGTAKRARELGVPVAA